MDFNDCIEFAKATHTCYMATVDKDQPHVRPIGMWFADQSGFYFQTETVKSLDKQLRANKKVELCFFGGQPARTMRVTGQIEFLNDADLKSRVIKERTFLKGLDDIVSIFRMAKGEAFFWTMADNMKESQIERIRFGGA
jgi:pyridoxamine 5'-phosphate oxidase